MSASEVDAFYRHTFGIEPYQFQVRLCQVLLSERRSVVLQAPTGAGKTLAALAPFFLAREKQLPFPQRAIYSLPLRVLANSLKADLEAFPRVAERYTVTIQTGEHPDDRQFMGEVIFATIDQSLSSFLNLPITVPHGSANINAGAILSSYLIFDEVHLLDAKRAFSLVYCMLDLLKGITPFVIMTATLSRQMINELAVHLGAVPLVVSAEEAEQMASQRAKERYVSRVEEPLTVGRVLANHTPQDRAIVICNTVERAQSIYRDLLQAKRPETELFLLHSRFLLGDRQRNESRVRAAFGKGGTRKDVILVATQVIEVGLDISASKMHVEIAPGDALIQRIGRCARYAGETGEVFVYDVLGDTGKRFLPYPEQECIKAWEHLGSEPRRLDWSGTLSFIEETCSAKDQAILEWIDQNKVQFTREMADAIDLKDSRYYNELIRKIDTVLVTAISNPDPKDELFDYVSLSLPRSVLRGFLNRYRDVVSIKGQWLAKVVLPGLSDDIESSNYKLKEVTGPDDVLGPLVVINPDFVSYDPKIGFFFEAPALENHRWIAAKIGSSEKDRFSGSEHRREGYQEHIARTRKAFLSFREKELGQAALAVEEKLGLPPQSIAFAAELAILFHDIGKLNERWQEAIYAIDGSKYDPWFPLAHSGSATGTKGFRLPPHAGASAQAIVRSLPSVIAGNLAVDEKKQNLICKSVLWAIMTHHSPTVQQVGQYMLLPVSEKLVGESLRHVGIQGPPVILRRTGSSSQVSPLILAGHDWNEYFLYALVVRSLRLADRLSFEVNLA